MKFNNIVQTENISFEQIYQTLQHHFNKLQEQYAVKTLGVFGSYARREATESSDIDVLVEFEGALTFDKYMNLKFFLEDLFVKKVDLVIKDDLKQQIKEKVFKETIYVSRSGSLSN